MRLVDRHRNGEHAEGVDCPADKQSNRQRMGEMLQNRSCNGHHEKNQRENKNKYNRVEQQSQGRNVAIVHRVVITVSRSVFESTRGRPTRSYFSYAHNDRVPLPKRKTSCSRRPIRAKLLARGAASKHLVLV